MTAFSIFSDDDLANAIPLDVEPLIAPYMQHRRVSIRIERLPPRSRLSKGRNNGDGTFSLRPDEVHDLAFIPPDGADKADFTLAVRIVKLDGDYASTLDLLDLAVDAGAVYAPSNDQQSAGERQGKAARASLDGRWRKNGGAASRDDGADSQVETEKLQRAFDVLAKALAETEARAEHAEAQIAEFHNRAEAADTALAEARGASADGQAQQLTDLRKQLDAAENDHTAEIARLKEAHAAELEKQAVAIRTAVGGDGAKQAAEAVRQAEKSAAAQLHEARRAWQAEVAERAAAAARSHDTEKAALQKQLAAATKEIAAARTQTSEELQQAHMREIAELESVHGKALEEREAAFAERLAVALREAEEAGEARLRAAHDGWRSEADKSQTTALAAARDAWQDEAAGQIAAAAKPLKSEIAALQKELAAAAKQVEAADVADKALTRELADQQAAHARALDELQRAHDKTLREQIAATKADLEKEAARRGDKALQAAAKDAAKQADQRLAAQRKTWQADAAATLAAAREEWQAESAKQLADSVGPLEGEITALEQKLAAAEAEIAAARRDVESAREQSADAAQSSHAEAIAEMRREHESALAEAVAAARTDKETELADRLATAETAHEEALAAARNASEQDLADRLAAAEAEHAAELAERDAALAAARETAADPAELAELREQLAAITGERDTLRRQLDVAAEEARVVSAAAASASESGGDPDFEARLAQAVHQAETAAEERLAEQRKVWETSAQAVLATAKEKWQAAEDERLAVAMKQWQKGIRKGDKTRQAPRFAFDWRYRNWLPRRSLMITAAVAGLIALATLHPDVKFLLESYSRPLVSVVKQRIEPRSGPAPIAAEAPPPPPLTAPLQPVERRAVVNVDGANIRSGPSTQDGVVRSLDRDSAVILLESRGEWRQIRFGVGAADTGWVHSDLLRDPS